jgi:UDP-glucose-4-epimerase GalE
MKRVLVTGGAGYIGSHTCKALAQSGLEPVTLDNLVYGHEWAVKWGPFVEGDIQDRSLVIDVLSRYHIEGVIHFAAFAYVGESMEDPGKYYWNNLAGTISLLEAMRECGCPKMVFSSSCATYGLPETIPIPETHPQQPINPYGRSKWMNEQILLDYAAAYGFRFASLRYFNAAGADPDGELGEEHDPETHLIPLAIQTVLGKRPHIDIYGTDYDTADGTAVRDYIHVTDLAAAHVSAYEKLAVDNTCFALNLGTGTGHSVLEVIKAVEKASGKNVLSENKPRRPGDPPVLVADPDKAKEALDWEPRIRSIEKIVETAWKWHLSRHGQ